MNNKLQTKDLIKPRSVHGSLLCHRVLCCYSHWVCSDLSSCPRKSVVADYRHPFHAVPHQG